MINTDKISSDRVDDLLVHQIPLSFVQYHTCFESCNYKQELTQMWTLTSCLISSPYNSCLINFPLQTFLFILFSKNRKTHVSIEMSFFSFFRRCNYTNFILIKKINGRKINRVLISSVHLITDVKFTRARN